MLSGKDYRLYEVKKENWQPIAAEETSPVIAFVDGGNAELLKTPAANLHRIRTAVVFVARNKLIRVRQKEGYILVKATVKQAEGQASSKVTYKAEFFDSDLDETSAGKNKAAEFNSWELSTDENNSHALNKAAESVRRLCEISAVRWAVKELAKNEGNAKKFVVTDGTLEAFFEKEKNEMAPLYAEAKENDIAVGAVAKTCSLLTESGESLIAAAEAISNGQEGYAVIAKGLMEKHTAAVAIAKLNNSALHFFRIEATNSSELSKLVAALKMQSNDLAFPGYPYGLIMADRFARVSEHDTGLMKAKIRATAGAEVKALLKDEKALDAHSILDRM